MAWVVPYTFVFWTLAIVVLLAGCDLNNPLCEFDCYGSPSKGTAQ